MSAQALLDVLRRGHPDRLYSIEELLDLARQYRFDGSITLHFRGGYAAQFDTGRPLIRTLRAAAEGRSLSRPATLPAAIPSASAASTPSAAPRT